MLHITEHKRHLKMEGFISINTSAYQNPYCLKQHRNKKLVCSRCYGLSMENSYRRLHNCVVNNTKELIEPLSSESLDNIVKTLKCYNKKFIRYHSIGELVNEVHLKNFYDITSLTPESTFGIWTKRGDIVRKCKEKKPDNLSMVYSNPVIDKPLRWIPEGFNGLFNVVSYNYCKEHNIVPNCHGRCIECLKCYRPDKKNIALELLKSDQTKINKGQLEPLV